MKYLVVVRHGTLADPKWVRELGLNLAGRLKESRIILYSSTAAKETAKIISRCLGIPFATSECLDFDSRERDRHAYKDTLRLVGVCGQRHDAVVLASHAEGLINEFPSLWGQEMGFALSPGNEPCGAARVIDIGTGREVRIRPPKRV